MIRCQESINETREMIARHEESIRESPSKAMNASLRSYQKMLRKLEAEFAEYQSRIGATVGFTPTE